MLPGAIERLKPGAPMRIHLLLAAMTWTIVGLGLLGAGVAWTVQAGPAALPAWLATSAAVGVLKAAFALRPAARRVIERIVAHGDGRCIGGFFSWRTWIFVIAMSVAGRLLRGAGLPLALTGALYVAVGSALLIASAWLWRAWARQER